MTSMPSSWAVRRQASPRSAEASALLRIERVGADGDGIGRLGDRPVFVPLCLPGESRAGPRQRRARHSASRRRTECRARQPALPAFRRVRWLRAAALGGLGLRRLEACGARGRPAPGRVRRGPADRPGHNAAARPTARGPRTSARKGAGGDRAARPAQRNRRRYWRLPRAAPGRAGARRPAARAIGRLVLAPTRRFGGRQPTRYGTRPPSPHRRRTERVRPRRTGRVGEIAARSRAFIGRRPTARRNLCAFSSPPASPWLACPLLHRRVPSSRPRRKGSRLSWPPFSRGCPRHEAAAPELSSYSPAAAR